VYKPQHSRVRLNHCQRFGLRVKELRAEREITQEELSDRVGVFRTYMSRIESGGANATLTTIHAIADALAVPVSALFEAPSAPALLAAKRVRAPRGASRGRVK